jgi:hypothetical protein
MLNDLLPVATDFGPDVVVHEAGELAAPIVAAAIGVPNITHSFGGLVVKERVAAASAEVAALWESKGLESRPYAGCYDHLYLDIYPPSLQFGDASHASTVQPLQPVPFVTAGSEVLPAIVAQDDGRPLVYFTFGTVFNTDIALLATIMNALAALPVRVLVTVGPGGRAGLSRPPTRERACSPIRTADPGTSSRLARGLTRWLRDVPRLPRTWDPSALHPPSRRSVRQLRSRPSSGAGLAIEPGAVSVDRVRGTAGRLLGEPAFREAARKDTVGP